MGPRKKISLKGLSTGRPPTATSARCMSRTASRRLINRHHQLEKQLRQAAENGNQSEEARLARELDALGGLKVYQQASLLGQSNERGGDTSKILLQWLPAKELGARNGVFRMLEVGALSTQNACSTSGIFDMTRIDLNSQGPGIMQQDFMKRPLPLHEGEKFHVISLSLVLNFVPDPAARGMMLLRTLSFLRSPSGGESTDTMFPSLFIVLPKSCIENSRYFTRSRFEELMGLLGYTQIRSKMTQKLAYSLWKRASSAEPKAAVLQKKKLNPGGVRNNFAIILRPSGGHGSEVE